MITYLTHHPRTFEFIPGLSLTRLYDANVIILTFGTYSLEIVFFNNNHIDNNDNGDPSQSNPASA